MYWLPPTRVKQSGAATITGGHVPAAITRSSRVERLEQRVDVEQLAAGAGVADDREQRRVALARVVAGRHVDVEVALGRIAERIAGEDACWADGGGRRASPRVCLSEKDRVWCRAVSAVVTVQDLHKHYGDRRVLRGVSFAVHERDRIGMIGANGAGKSTLLKMMVHGAGAGPRPIRCSSPTRA